MPSRPDILVVGAGVIGCAVGYELARRGAAVEIVDDRLPGMGATQASAGVLAPFIEARDHPPLLELTRRSLAQFTPFVETLVDFTGTPVEYKRTGTIDVALGTDAFERHRGTASMLAAAGVEATLLDASAARREEPYLSKEVAGALVIPEHGFIGALDFTRALATAAQRHGACLTHGVRVREIRASGDGFVIDADDRAREAGRVVVALGTWSGRVSIAGVTDAVPVEPVRGQLLHLGWRDEPLRRVTWSDRCYLVPWQGGTVLVGATVEQAGFDERTTTAGVRDLIEAACEVVPHAWTASLISARAGLRPSTPDHLPIIGPSAVLPGLFYATGHFRNGILLTPLTATAIADLVLEGRADPQLASAAPARFGRL